MSSFAQVNQTESGTNTLLLRGEWGRGVEDALVGGGWEELVLHGVEWVDYSPLTPFQENIRRMKVLLGPDCSRGLDQLAGLERLVCRDVLSPPVDFRKLTTLRHLDAFWEKRRPEYCAHSGLHSLSLANVGGADLTWVPQCNSLLNLEISKGRLQSLRGISAATYLTRLKLSGLGFCIDAEDIQSLSNLEFLELEGGKLEFESIDWISRLKKLKELKLFARVNWIDWRLLASQPHLRSIAIVAGAGYFESDETILSAIRDAGRDVSAFRRFSGKVPSFSISLGE